MPTYTERCGAVVGTPGSVKHVLAILSEELRNFYRYT